MKSKEKKVENYYKKYESEIDKLMERNGGYLTPEIIVEEAKKENSPLHDYFTWNDSEEAHLWRVHKARILFGNVVQNIKIKSTGETKVIRKYIKVKEDDKSFYVRTTLAIKNKNYAQQIISDCISLSASLTNKLKLFQDNL